MITKNSILAANGLVACPLASDEEPQAVIDKIETLVYAFVKDLVEGRANGSFTMIRRTARNACEDPVSGAIYLGDKVTRRKFNFRTAGKVAQLFKVLEVVHLLLLKGKRISQRELYYLLIDSFRSQQQLNNIVLDVSATLGVPRFAINIGAATRGVVAGCVRLALAGSPYQVDCRYVGTNGWPIPGDVSIANSLIVHSTAHYIIVIEKFGVFSRLVQDRIFDKLPVILVCGKGYPSIATRAVSSLLASRLRIPVLGLADFNPHGLTLLQVYRRGSGRSGVEGSRFVCDVKWLGLRSSHIAQHKSVHEKGEELTKRDLALLEGMERGNGLIEKDVRYQHEIDEMRRLGKYELQWMYGKGQGTDFFTEGFVIGGILHGNYI